MVLEMPRKSFQEENSLLSCPLFTSGETTPIICYGMSSILRVINVIDDGGPIRPGAVVTWDLPGNKIAARSEKIFLFQGWL